jgi:hypothetical protein
VVVQVIENARKLGNDWMKIIFDENKLLAVYPIIDFFYFRQVFCLWQVPCITFLDAPLLSEEPRRSSQHLSARGRCRCHLALQAFLPPLSHDWSRRLRTTRSERQVQHITKNWPVLANVFRVRGQHLLLGYVQWQCPNELQACVDASVGE